MTTVPQQFTAAQITDFRAYEAVRRVGRFNMLDPRARLAAGLTRDEYLFVLKHFDALRDADAADRPARGAACPAAAELPR